jgi:methionyl aminopeptidase
MSMLRAAETKAFSPQQEQSALDAAQVVVRAHQEVSQWLRVGVTLPQVDAFVRDCLEKQGAASCFYQYKPGRRIPPFPSHACLSVNDCVVHGTAASVRRPMQAGDVLKIDIGCKFRGWIGDAGWTYVFGEPTPKVARLMQCGKESLAAGVAAMQPGRKLHDFAKAVQGVVEGKYGYHLVRGLGGHGLFDPKRGLPTLHGPPFVANRMPDRSEHGESWPDGHTLWAPGMLVAVEPMIGETTGELGEKAPGEDWPECMADGCMSVHYEHDVLMTAGGNRVLTQGLEEVVDVVAK